MSVENVKEIAASVANVEQDNVAVVWYSKILQNYKGLVVTLGEESARYIEVTYNGDKKEHYADIYQKQKNFVVTDSLHWVE